MRRFAFWSITGFVLGLPSLVLAATFNVAPGPGTPVQDAIDAAAPGDTIRLTIGYYDEDHLVVTKPLKIRGARSGDGSPGMSVFLSSCPGDGLPMLDVAADGVQVRTVGFAGADGGGVRVVASDRVKLQDVIVGSNCPSVTAPAFDVEGSTRVTMSKVWAAGSPASEGPAGIRIAGTPERGIIKVTSSIAGTYDTGVLIEGNGDRAVKVSSSWVNFNAHDGIVVRDTNGARVSRSREVLFNTDRGIAIEGTSTGNKIVGNRIDGSTLDVSDGSTGNCWKSNTFTTGTDPGCS